MKKTARLITICDRINRDYKAGNRHRAFVNATRLWNLIDHWQDPEYYWYVLGRSCPWFFVNPFLTNSAKFTYAD